MIRIDGKYFRLDTQNTTYIFKVVPTGHLVHVYYGKKLMETDYSFIEEHDNLRHVIVKADDDTVKDYAIPFSAELRVKDGELIEVGKVLTGGSVSAPFPSSLRKPLRLCLLCSVQQDLIRITKRL